MVILRDEPGHQVGRIAQGPKSKTLHFDAKLCGACNSRATQPAGLAFDKLHSEARRRFDQGNDPSAVFESPEFRREGALYLDAFRYFAKLMCCHLAELGSPRPVHMSEFARGKNDTNCVWLQIDLDWDYRQLPAGNDGMRYAAHGGLVLYGNRHDGGPNAFHSTRTIGPIRYVFWSRLTVFERIELAQSHPEFWSWCQTKSGQADSDPLDDEHCLRLGLPIHQ